jgi:Fic-DOC domain mobile mystery protein B
MFRDTWRWAGTYRRTQKSIGVEAYRVATEVRNLLDDLTYWLEFNTYSPAETVARFHHRLVQVHPFANGNGRHARLATDLLCEREGWPISEWGACDFVQMSETRSQYIKALRSADAYDLGPLLAFMGLAR